MKRLIRENIVFISLSLMLIAALGLALLCIPKGELHLILCDHHTPARDLFFKYYTQIAEYLPYIICAMILLWGRTGDGLLATACIAGSDLTTQVLKHAVNAPRPITWFASNMPDVQLPLVEGVRMNHWFSFPSGHTTAFFSLAFIASILLTGWLAASSNEQSNSGSRTCKRLYSVAVQVLLFTAAALGGYSRIYLSQHFAADVCAGIGIGLVIPCIMYLLFAPAKEKKWYNYRLLSKKMR